MRNLDFSHLYSNAVGFERMARELEGLFVRIPAKLNSHSGQREHPDP
ncbi:hypothetical protein WP2S18C03_00110 [Aeromonas veronii]|nr:hypothetical protein WP2S18C03_00110 [Aeromonas veronii]